MRPLLLLPALALGLSACASLPDAPRERGLYVDVRKAIEFEEEVDWVADRLEVEEVLPNVMGSVCRTSAETRRKLAGKAFQLPGVAKPDTEARTGTEG